MANDTMTKNTISRITEMIKAGYSFSSIVNDIDVNYNQVSRVFYEFIKKPIKQPEVILSIEKERYYELESDIEKELNLTYSIDDLNGDELEILKKLNESR